MTTVVNPVRVTFIFGLHGPSGIEDTAEFNLWSDLGSTGLPTDWDTALEDIAHKAYDFWGTNVDDAIFRTSVTLESVKAAHLNTALLTLHEQVYNPSTKWAGTGTGASLPWQVSLCIGLYTYTPGTFIAHARSRRGRIYLPPMTSAVLDIPTKGTLSDSRVLDTLTWVAGFLHDVSNIVPDTSSSIDLSLGVVSRIQNKTKLSTPVINGLTDVACDGVLDSQRRRTHQETKVRQSVQVT